MILSTARVHSAYHLDVHVGARLVDRVWEFVRPRRATLRVPLDQWRFVFHDLSAFDSLATENKVDF